MSGFKLLKGMAFEWNGAAFQIDRLQANGDVLLERADGQLIVTTRTDLLSDYAKGLVSTRKHHLSPREATASLPYSRPMSDLPIQTQTEALRRWRYVNALQSLGTFVFTKAFLQDVIEDAAKDMNDANPPSTITLYRWYKRYRTHQDTRALVPRTEKRGCRDLQQRPEILTLAAEATEEAFKFSPLSTGKNIYTRLNAKIDAANRQRAATEHLKRPTLRTVYRMLSRVEAYDQVMLKEGKAAADRRFRLGKRGTTTSEILERVEVDHTPLDLFLIDEKTWLPLGRPTLTVLIDHFSRMPLGYHLSFDSPSTAAVMRALRHAILPKPKTPIALPGLLIEHPWPCYGQPDLLIADNGLEFHSNDLESVCYDLDIELRYCPKHQPRFKGTIERYLKTINYFFAHQLPGTSFARLHMRGDYDPQKHAVLTMGEFQHLFEKWVLDVYAQSIHRNLGVTPWSKWHEGLTRREPELPDDLQDLQARIGLVAERSLRRDGIALNGIQYGGGDLQPILSAYGEGVRVRVIFDPDDLGRIQVWGPDQEEPVEGHALNPEYANGLTLKQHEMIRAQLREHGAETEDHVALEKAKHDLIVSVQTLLDSRKQKHRRKAAEIQGFSSSNPQSALTESNAAPKKKSKPPITVLPGSPSAAIDALPLARFQSISLKRGDRNE